MMADLLVDGTRTDGKVLWIAPENKARPRITELASDVERFSSTSQGDYLYKVRGGGWWTNHVLSGKGPTEIFSPPPNAEDAILSPDATAIVWSLHTAGTSALVLSDAEGLDQRELKRERGFVRQPAWSPDAATIAYYWGAPDVLVTGAYTLKTIRVADAADRELAPASKPIGLTSERGQPPQWSPDSSRILFVGNHELGDLVRAWGYVVPAAGGVPRRVEGGNWSADGAHLLYLRRTSLPFGPFVLAVLDLGTDTSRDISLAEELPPSVANGKWNKNGKMFAFTTTENELCVIELEPSMTLKLAGISEGASLSWLELDPAPRR